MRSDVDSPRLLDEARPALDSRAHLLRVLVCTRALILLLSILALAACGTRTLEMPPPQPVGSPAGPMVEVADVTDERLTPTLGKVDSYTIDSGPDLLKYIEAELMNSLFRMGLSVRQVVRSEPLANRKRVQVALLSAELESESTLLYPVAATVRLRAEVTDEFGKSTFRREFRGAISRDLGMHAQGGPEDATVLAEVIDQAMATLVADKSFVAAVSLSPEEAERRRSAEKQTRELPQDTGGGAQVLNGAEEPPRTDSTDTVERRLRNLDQLLEKGLISKDDYVTKRREVLDEL